MNMCLFAGSKSEVIVYHLILHNLLFVVLHLFNIHLRDGWNLLLLHHGLGCLGRKKHRLRWRSMENESVVDLHELHELIFFQTHETLERRRLFPGATHAVHDVTFLLFANEENVEHFNLIEIWKEKSLANGRFHEVVKTYLALTAVVRRFVLRSSMELHFDAFRLHKLQNLHRMLERLEHAISVNQIIISQWKRAIHHRKTHLTRSNIFGSETLMFLARFQLRCTIGTMDL